MFGYSWLFDKCEKGLLNNSGKMPISILGIFLDQLLMGMTKESGLRSCGIRRTDLRKNRNENPR
jgi:hypothetical protein